MDSIVSQKLTAPAFEFITPDLWRPMLAANLAEHDSLQAAFCSGLQAATPGMAFLFGYQSAIRCLHKDCPADQLAALVVSEKGVKSPKDFKASVLDTESGLLLSGDKSHAMLVPDLLDTMYVVAKQAGKLVGVRLDNVAARMMATNSGIEIIKSVQSPFVQDIPHASVRFTELPVAHLMVSDGHGRWNKPFRYWEDMHVAAAMLAWMYRWAGASEDLLGSYKQLQQQLQSSPAYYQAESFELLDLVLQQLDQQANALPEKKMALWQQDRLLLQMGAKIRQQVKSRLFI